MTVPTAPVTAPAFAGTTFIGFAAGGRWLVFSNDFGWGCRVFSTLSGAELEDVDPDFPRFWVDGDLLFDGLEDVSSAFIPA